MLHERKLTGSGGFWLTFASTLTPFYNAFGAYSPDPTKPAEGLTSPAFAASFGMFTGALPEG